MAVDGCAKSATSNSPSPFGGKCPDVPRAWLGLMARYILQINLMDHAGTLWVTAFNEVAEQVMGVTANDLHKLKVGCTAGILRRD